MSRTHLLSAVSFGVISRCVPFYRKLVRIIAFVFTVSFNNSFLFLCVFKFLLCHHMSFFTSNGELEWPNTYRWPVIKEFDCDSFHHQLQHTKGLLFVKLHQHSSYNYVNSSSYQLNHIIIRILSLDKHI